MKSFMKFRILSFFTISFLVSACTYQQTFLPQYSVLTKNQVVEEINSKFNKYNNMNKGFTLSLEEVKFNITKDKLKIIYSVNKRFHSVKMQLDEFDNVFTAYLKINENSGWQLLIKNQN